MDREEILSFGSSAIDSAVGLNDLQAAVYELRDRFEVTHLAYHTVRPPGSEGEPNILLALRMQPGVRDILNGDTSRSIRLLWKQENGPASELG